jgi:Flp pilus assembly pilin Flp
VRVPRRGRADIGATAVEYALISALIAGVIGVVVSALGQQVVALFQSVPIPFG